MLVRRFIGRRLAEYYAQPSHKVVGRSTELEAAKARGEANLLSSLMGEWHWKRVFQRIYDEREGHWLTPVELFQPHYSYILGDFCSQFVEKTQKSTAKRNNSTACRRHKNYNDSSSIQPFEIVELGGGRGTNASLILSYLKEYKPCVYSSLASYTLVDASPTLHKTQMERFSGNPKVRCELIDLVDVAQGTTLLFSKSNVPTIVIGMEVLDNLPHDKIRGKIRHKLEQAEVVPFKDKKSNAYSKREKNREKFVPLSDPLLKMMLRTVPNYYTENPDSSLHTNACWVPSIACGVLRHIIHQRPNLGLVMADFDWLPAPDLNLDQALQFGNETPAEGSPIVTDMKGIDHKSYLTAPPHCDILFPTDFGKLESFVKRCIANVTKSDSSPVVRVEKQSQFLERWGPRHVAKTKSWLTGHTPLLHDFVNCSVLTISPEDT